jgi:hypothetical protein
MPNATISRRDFLKASGSLVVAFCVGPLLHALPFRITAMNA